MLRGVNKFAKTFLAAFLAQSRSPRRGDKRAFYGGFTLLELMIVLSVMMILMAVALPFYQHHVIQAREAVLKQNLDTLDKVIEQYRMDKRESPQSFDDLVSAGYLHQLPTDPMTGKADWVAEQEDSTNALDPQQPGISRAHSASTGSSLSGEAYSTW
jgi:general secretion pathway protein G